MLSSKYVVSFIARLDNFKDPLTFIRAAHLIIKDNPNIHFLIAGNGPLMDQVIKESSHLLESNRIKILGWIDNPDALISISNLFVSLSPVENIWSMSLVEALKAGVPCIVTDSGTTSSHLVHMKTAYIIEPNNPESLRDAIIFLLKNQEVRENIGKNAQNLIKNVFPSNEQIRDEILRLYYAVRSR